MAIMIIKMHLRIHIFLYYFCIVFVCLSTAEAKENYFRESNNYIIKRSHYLSIAIDKCRKGKNDNKRIYDTDYTWEYTFEEVEQVYHKIYESGKRLPKHIYYDINRAAFFMPIDDNFSYSSLL